MASVCFGRQKKTMPSKLEQWLKQPAGFAHDYATSLHRRTRKTTRRLNQVSGRQAVLRGSSELSRAIAQPESRPILQTAKKKKMLAKKEQKLEQPPWVSHQ
jgi:hypothetical protein